jgi:hypothetical protein
MRMRDMNQGMKPEMLRSAGKNGQKPNVSGPFDVRELAKQGRRRIASSFIALVAGSVLLASSACGKNLPDPVTKANGIATIPIDGLVFVIPERTWLKGYSRNSTDGLVYGFTLHAVAPKVEPWSPESNEKMYKVPGWGTRIEIRISSNEGRPFIKQTAPWIEQTTKGCHFQRSKMHSVENIVYCETEYERRFAYVEGDQFRYQISCDSYKVKAAEKFPTDPECRLRFFYGDKLSVHVVFAERYFPHAFDMARAIEAKLIEFDKTPQHINTTKEQGK